KNVTKEPQTKRQEVGKFLNQVNWQHNSIWLEVRAKVVLQTVFADPGKVCQHDHAQRESQRYDWIGSGTSHNLVSV
ncbi:hypothetical protein L0P10_19550, partial [Eggerthella lenta]|nr:hypothetical protein [Eggerthella lenta]